MDDYLQAIDFVEIDVIFTCLTLQTYKETGTLNPKKNLIEKLTLLQSLASLPLEPIYDLKRVKTSRTRDVKRLHVIFLSWLDVLCSLTIQMNLIS